ncbi:hypothetical protein HDU88_002555 [Geranomyces variabilis]|nr:hypothetical protein HDU88_002555 [Geranomyces variabilis]
MTSLSGHTAVQSQTLMHSAPSHGPPTLPNLVPPCLPHRIHPVYNKYHFAQCAGTLPVISSTLGGIASPSADSLGGGSTTANRLEQELVRAITANLEQRVCELLDAEPERGRDSLNRLSLATGLAPIHYAAARGFLGIFRELQNRGAEVELPDKEGETSLLKAAYGGHIEVLQHILETRTDVDHQDRDGWSALHNCSSRGYVAATRAIIEAGGNVNIRSNTGHTPLMSASAKGFVNVVELLLDNEADALVKNKFDDTAYDLAAQAEESYICEILLRAEQDALDKQDRGSGSSRTRKVLMVQHNSVIETVHENQRCGFLSRQFSENNLTKNDTRSPWSTPMGRPCGLDDVQLPFVKDAQTGQEVRGWFWLSDWRVDIKHPRVDPSEGWQYAKGFDDPDLQWSPVPPGTVLNSCVRRRRWIRVRKRRADVRHCERSTEVTPEAPTSSGDYVVAARFRIDSLPTTTDVQGLESIRSEAQAYETSIKELLAGIKDDTDVARKRTGSILVASYLERAEELNTLLDTLEEHDGFDSAGDQNELPARSNGEGLARSSRGGSSDMSMVRPQTPDNSAGGSNIDGGGVWPAGIHSIHALRTDSEQDSTLLQAVPVNPIAGVDDSVPLSMSPPSSWQPDDDAPFCESCDRRFTLFLRRHHCRWCGRVFCASCTSLRLPLIPNSPAHRVCRSCYQYVSSRNQTPLASRTPSATSLVTRTATSEHQHNDPPSPSRSTASAAESAMNECPVCQRYLDPDLMSEGDIEGHVATCLNGVATSTGDGQNTISGNRYIVQTLKEPLPGCECAICFEEFLRGHRIARLNCLCLYHEHCIEAWWVRVRKRTCPVHFR